MRNKLFTKAAPAPIPTIITPQGCLDLTMRAGGRSWYGQSVESDGAVPMEEGMYHMQGSIFGQLPTTVKQDSSWLNKEANTKSVNKL